MDQSYNPHVKFYIMDELLKFTPEQLAVLSPDQIKIILECTKNVKSVVSLSFNDDIKNMKLFFSNLIYEVGDCCHKCVYKKSEYDKLNDLLLKNKSSTFYLTYQFELYISPGTYISALIKFPDKIKYTYIDWQLCTEDEIKNILPTGIDLEKIIVAPMLLNDGLDFTKNKIDFFPIIREKSERGELLEIQEFSLVHKNLKYVHPLILAYAQYLIND